MILEQWFDLESSTYTYLIADELSGDAALIDPVLSESDFYINESQKRELAIKYILDTHTHADHISANGQLRDQIGAQTWLGKESKSSCIDHKFVDGTEIKVGSLTITALHTPGHTDDSYSFHVKNNGQNCLFTGDTLLINGSGRTDFQQGDAGTQYESIFNKLLSYPDDTIVYPGHDYSGNRQSTVGKEKANNPRLQVKNKAAYIELMNNLNLPNPKLMDVAVPANQACGKV
ncbi:MBL fold metallo-hydrolase [Agaribacterium haliotis]|uniref:MBL fold metallo-hydrolase n=1 Tax=Agaribacterium haliotis TaxID=2013869 RepID=UPI000BB53E7B|nr:MBL fold metallo-hydrolase [Agaribacterium haliotis]